MSAASRPSTIVEAAGQLSHLPAVRVVQACWDGLAWLAAVNALCAVGLVPAAALWSAGAIPGPAAVSALCTILAPAAAALFLAPAVALAAHVAPRILRGERTWGCTQVSTAGGPCRAGSAHRPGARRDGEVAYTPASRRRPPAWVRAVGHGAGQVRRVALVLLVPGLASSALLAALVAPAGLPLWWRAVAAWCAGAAAVTGAVVTPFALAVVTRSAALPDRPRARTVWAHAARRAAAHRRAAVAIAALTGAFVLVFLAWGHTAVLILPGPLSVAGAACTAAPLGSRKPN